MMNQKNKILLIWVCLLLAFQAGAQKEKEAEKNAGLNFDCSPAGYFMIEGVKYFHEDVFYTCMVKIGTGTRVSIAAYFDNGDDDPTPFPVSTQWTGPHLENTGGSTVTFKRKEPTASTNAPFEVVASYDQSGNTYSMQINIVVVRLEFVENGTQEYGFDDNKWDYTNTYSSNVTPHNYSWKSVEIGHSDVFNCIIEPGELQSNVSFVSSNSAVFPVSPLAMSNNPQPVVVNANAQGIGDISATESQLGSCSATDHHSIVSIAPYTKSVRDLKFVLVAEENDDVQDIEIGEGAPYAIAIGPGANGVFESQPVPNDEIIGGYITTGFNGILETQVAGDDYPFIEYMQGLPDAACITVGDNGFRDTPELALAGDDYLDGDVIYTGPDGICQTDASDENINAEVFLNFDLDQAYDYLSDIYSAAVFDWIPETLPIILYSDAVNYDLDRDGKLDVGDVGQVSTSEEIDALLAGSSFYTPAPDLNYVFFTDYAVDHAGATDIEGVSNFNVDYSFVFPGGVAMGNGGQTLFSKTIAHELGHAGFGLLHPTDEYGAYWPQTDKHNLMDYSDPEEYEMILRKYQWDHIQW